MESTQPVDEQKKTLDVIDAIYTRHAVRHFLDKPVEKDTIKRLLDAANHAPAALHEESKGFVVIQDKAVLDRLSESAKHLIISDSKTNKNEGWQHVIQVIKQNEFNVFYNAPTLIVIYSTIKGPFVSADCWLAAQNLMLAALPYGLGSCVIGFAVSALNSAQWKKELGISAKMTAVAPIIIGWPSDKTLPVTHHEPLILKWA
ncbi:MAG: nitroreductase family protein [bacterium]|nr:nitroreductase family protein [bacterium]